MRLTALLVALLLPVTGAMAQDYEDLDETEEESRRRRDRESIRAELEEEIVREIVRGFYLKAGVGGGAFIGRYGAIPPEYGGSMMSTVATTPITVGQDFVDNERSSMAWEVSVVQSVYNGLSFETQGVALRQGVITPDRLIQGDIRMFSFTAAYEYSAYPSRRLGIGVRAGGGVALTPLLMDGEAYSRDVVGSTWSGSDSGVHSTPHPLGFIGPTIEYYTKLSHFSVGADIEAAYILGMDLNIGGVGYLKYTF